MVLLRKYLRTLFVFLALAMSAMAPDGRAQTPSERSQIAAGFVAPEALPETVRLELEAINKAFNVAAAKLSVGIFSSLASGFLANLLRNYTIDHPGVWVEIVEGSRAENISNVTYNCLDIAFVAGTPVDGKLDAATFWQEHVFVAIPTGHALADNASVTWHDIRDATFIVSIAAPGPEIFNFLIKHLGDLGVHPDVEHCCVSRDNLMHMVSFGRALTLTSEATIGTTFPGVVFRRLETDALPFSGIWSRDNDNPAFRRFLALAKTMTENQTGLRLS